MRNIQELQSNLGNIDLYLLDQILKNRYKAGESILEAGCGNGRNIHLLNGLGLRVSGIDKNYERIKECKRMFPDIKEDLFYGDLTKTPFSNEQFDHIVSSAVLHFSDSEDHFFQLIEEHVRILRRSGSLFIRMTTAFGLDPKVLKATTNGRYILPDESERFLLTYTTLYSMMKKYGLHLLEPVKTVNVHEMRAMGLVVLQKY